MKGLKAARSALVVRARRLALIALTVLGGVPSASRPRHRSRPVPRKRRLLPDHVRSPPCVGDLHAPRQEGAAGVRAGHRGERDRGSERHHQGRWNLGRPRRLLRTDCDERSLLARRSQGRGRTAIVDPAGREPSRPSPAGYACAVTTEATVYCWGEVHAAAWRMDGWEPPKQIAGIDDASPSPLTVSPRATSGATGP